jgi:hypothetical protein
MNFIDVLNWFPRIVSLISKRFKPAKHAQSNLQKYQLSYLQKPRFGRLCLSKYFNSANYRRAIRSFKLANIG